MSIDSAVRKTLEETRIPEELLTVSDERRDRVPESDEEYDLAYTTGSYENIGDDSEESEDITDIIETNKLPSGVLGMYVPSQDQIYVKKDLEPYKKRFVMEHEKSHKLDRLNDNEPTQDGIATLKVGNDPIGRGGNDKYNPILSGFSSPDYGVELDSSGSYEPSIIN